MTTLTGTRRLVRLALRRDRIVLPVWIASLAALVAGVMASVMALYATEAERAQAAAFSAGSRVARVFDGPAAGTDPGTLGMVETFGFVAILVAIMSAQTVVRHTRQDEETGRAELMAAGVIGRHARLAAALLVAAAADLVLGVAVAATLVALDLEVAGSLLAGASFAAVGITFAGVAAVTSQVAEQARGANALAGAAIGAAFLLRAVGDAAGRVADSGVELVSAWPSWLSPIGWGQQVRPFGDARPWLLVLFVLVGLGFAALAFVLTDHRDVGRGMRAVAPGPATASPRLRSPLGLAWRQQRGVLLAWTIALAAAGAAFGIVGEGADEVVATSDQFQEMLARFGDGGALVDAYFAFLMRLLGIVAAGYTVQALLRLRAEESAGRVEPVLSTAVSRWRWLASHVALALVGTVVVLGLTGGSAGLAYGLAVGDLAGGFWAPAAAALVQIPAALALGALVVLAYAALPRRVTAVAWSALAIGLVLSQFGELLGLPQALLNVSPFTHPPLLPANGFTWVPVTALLTTTLVLALAGFGAFRRRDLMTT